MPMCAALFTGDTRIRLQRFEFPLCRVGAARCVAHARLHVFLIGLQLQGSVMFAGVRRPRSCASIVASTRGIRGDGV